MATVIGSRLRRSDGRVSGRANSAARVARPIPTSVQKIARHEANTRICPPTIGPINGAMAITVISVDIIWAARAPL